MLESACTAPSGVKVTPTRGWKYEDGMGSGLAATVPLQLAGCTILVENGAWALPLFLCCLGID